MAKHIVFVGRSYVEGGDTTTLKFGASNSLLDGDIVVLSPEIGDFTYGCTTYQGLPCLSDDESFRLQASVSHWQSELLTCLTSGKTVILFLTDAKEVYVDTGQRTYSGTGRNRHTTRGVSLLDLYSMLPTRFGKIVRRSGERSKKLGDLGAISSYWSEFGEVSPFEAYIEGFAGRTLLATQVGDKTLAGIAKQTNWTGNIVVLPPPDIDLFINDEVEAIEKRSQKAAETPEKRAARRKAAGKTIAAKLIRSICEIDSAISTVTDKTPTPTWVLDERFSLASEASIAADLDVNAQAIEALKLERAKLQKRVLTNND
jgi:hypothetical protein